MKKIIQNIYQRWLQSWENLSGRERMLLGAVVILTAAFLFFQFGVMRNLRKARAAQERVLQLHKDIASLDGLYMTFQDLRRQPQATPGQKKEVSQNSLLADLESYAQRANIKGNIRYMRPTVLKLAEGALKRSAEIKVEGVAASQLIDFLHDIENTGQSYFVEQFTFRTALNKEGFYDANMTISVLESKSAQ